MRVQFPCRRPTTFMVKPYDYGRDQDAALFLEKLEEILTDEQIDGILEKLAEINERKHPN